MKRFLFILVTTLMFGINVNANDVKLVNNIMDRIEIIDDEIITLDSIQINHCINRYLNLKEDQEMFYDVHQNVYDYIKLLNKKHELIMKEFNMNLNNDLRLSKLVLTDEQYKKYLRVINQTLLNNDLTKYITKQ